MPATPGGPRHLLWTVIVVQCIASLEAGLEDLLLAGHAFRHHLEGQPREGRYGDWLVEDALMAPGSEKIRRIVMAQYGVDLKDTDALPNTARFTLLKKAQAAAGAPTPDATIEDWKELRLALDSFAFVRNASTHHDIAKLTNTPDLKYGTGHAWAKTAAGQWRVQQPHCTNAARCVVAVYNLIAERLFAALGQQPAPVLPTPANVVT